MKQKLWIVVNRNTHKPVKHLGVHGSREAAQAMRDLHLESYEVDLKLTLEVREQNTQELFDN
ncbi:MAG: hypothetical protein CMP83_06610 [Gammaproteobacteria bacterium]|nr:hypothetical protein [Gammaproteobacteria bacterium]